MRECLMTNMSLGGVVIATTSPLPIGTPFLVRLHIEESGEYLELPGVVASQDVSADLSHEKRGMGIRFVNLSDEQRKLVSDLYEQGLKKAIEGG
jgi:Tfp pilus assembly protein PilZ